jgi:ribonuclease D
MAEARAPDAVGPDGVTADAPLVSVDPVPSDRVDPVPLVEPRDGVPSPVTTAAELHAVAAALAAGSGPVAVDAERASGYRYGQRAYLVQLRRAGAGTALVDPVAFDDDDDDDDDDGGLAPIAAAIADAEWVLHAASQDLPCLAAEGLRPQRLFDTELAGRLLGYPRVGLAAMVADVLGFALEKGHSAADWSTRPLPDAWLRYAALDVELLVELRDALADQLREQGKLDWALEEFAAIAAAPAPEPRAEPWRRTSGVHRIRRPRQLAVVRALWQTRDRLARARDLSPGRVLPDAAIVEAALAMPKTTRDLTALPIFGGRQTRRLAGTWLEAIDAARALPDEDLPSTSSASDAPPPARSWSERDPAAAARLTAARSAVAAIADEHALPTENLLAPDTVRRLSWQPPEPLDTDAVTQFLRSHGARPWQIALTATALTKALQRVLARP